MDHSPLPTFSSVDIGDPVLDGYRMSAKLALTLFHTKFIGNVPLDTDELVRQIDVAVRGDLSELLKRSLHCFPANFPTVNWVQRCHLWSARPSAGHKTGIAVSHPVQCGVKLLRSVTHFFF